MNLVSIIRILENICQLENLTTQWKIQKHVLKYTYSFLGNDYTPTFYGKWKVLPINLGLRDTKVTKVFNSLGSMPLEQEIFVAIERYDCIMYKLKRTSYINDVIWN